MGPRFRRAYGVGRGGLGRFGAAQAVGAELYADPASNAALASRTRVLVEENGWFPQSGIEDQLGSAYSADTGIIDEAAQEQLTRPLSAGIDIPSFVNPYRTVMYSVTGLSTTIPTRVIPGNWKRTYLMIQNLGPGNMYLGIGCDPNIGGQNVLNLVSTQVYEQIGGGFYLPPNPWYPDGLAVCSAFVSPEYISLMVDTLGTNAMILEGTFSPPRLGSTR